jgi:hypothetical protein
MKCSYMYLLSKYLVILKAEGQGKQWPPHWPTTYDSQICGRGWGGDAAECLWGSPTLKLSSYYDVCPQNVQCGETMANDLRLQCYISCVLQLEGQDLFWGVRYSQ